MFINAVRLRGAIFAVKMTAFHPYPELTLFSEVLLECQSRTQIPPRSGLFFAYLIT